MMRCRFCCSFAGAHRALQSEKVVGNTVEKIRSLIAAPPEIEAALRAYSARYPEDGASVEQALEFRRCVGEEFEGNRLATCSPLWNTTSEVTNCGLVPMRMLRLPTVW